MGAQGSGLYWRRTWEAQRRSACSQMSRRSRPLMAGVVTASLCTSSSDSCCAYVFRISHLPS